MKQLVLDHEREREEDEPLDAHKEEVTADARRFPADVIVHKVQAAVTSTTTNSYVKRKKKQIQKFFPLSSQRKKKI